MIPAVLGTTAIFSSGDPFWANVLFLLEGEGANNSTQILDSSSFNRTITRTGNPVISTARAKYGTGSISQPNTGDFVDISFNTILGSTWTFESWVWFPFWDDTCGVMALQTELSTLVFAAYVSGLSFWSGSLEFARTNATVPVNQWVHVALVCFNNVVDIFINGNKLNKVVSQSFSSFQSSVFVKARTRSKTRSPVNIDFFRLTKGVARYSTNFNPETDIVR
ncbi:LamG-like jellyroll fold domain-containing protein [Thermosynechococcus sp. FA-CM-4201]